MKENRIWFRKGIRDGIPIALGYFAVAFALGIMAKKCGLSPIEAFFAAGLTNASAGGYAAFSLIGAGASYLEMALTTLVVNARYLLMSCALSQKLDPKTPLRHRMCIAFDVTDEIFGISIGVTGNLNPFYNYGAMTVAIPGWALGCLFGALFGSILPHRLVSALSVSLYGMFLAIIIPPAKKNKVIAGAVVLAMGSSYAFSVIPFLAGISAGTKVIVLTVAISLAAAFLFPVADDETEADHET